MRRCHVQGCPTHWNGFHFSQSHTRPRQGFPLAGSVLTMERALQNVCAATGRSLAEMWVASSLNAARAIGISAHQGSLEVGKDADLVLLDEDFKVHLTMIEGEMVYSIGVADLVG